MYRLAIFDFDGTLADSLPVFLSAMNAAAARYGFRAVEPRDVERLRGQGAWQILEYLELPLWQAPMVTQFVRGHMAARLEAVRLFAGVHEALEDLAAHGVAIAIVSSNSEANVRRVLGARLASLVCDYRCDVSVFGKRPRLRQALAGRGVQPADAIVIGDELRDLKAARGEGIPFGGVSWGFTLPSALRAAGAEHMFEHVEDIARTLCPASRSLPA